MSRFHFPQWPQNLAVIAGSLFLRTFTSEVSGGCIHDYRIQGTRTAASRPYSLVRRDGSQPFATARFGFVGTELCAPGPPQEDNLPPV